MSEEKNTRREWLKLTGGAVAGLIVGGAAGYLAKPTVEVPGVTTTVTAPGGAGATATVTQTVNGAGGPTPFSDQNIRFLLGGEAGDTFASVIYNGAKEAAKDLGLKNVEYVFNTSGQGWNPDVMTRLFRDAVAAKPNGIVMMGHPGPDALKGLIDDAYNQGTVVNLTNVDLPDIRKTYASRGFGYVGASLYDFGVFLAEAAIKKFGFKAGDRAMVLGPFNAPGRLYREMAMVDTFKKAGMVVDPIQVDWAWGADPSKGVPTFSGYLLAHPDCKVLCLTGGQILAGAQMYMEAAGKKPGEVKAIGFDLAAGVVDGFDNGWIQLTADQQPYLQGYLPLAQLCLSLAYGLSGYLIDTGSGLIDETNYKPLRDLINAGIR